MRRLLCLAHPIATFPRCFSSTSLTMGPCRKGSVAASSGATKSSGLKRGRPLAPKMTTPNKKRKQVRRVAKKKPSSMPQKTSATSREAPAARSAKAASPPPIQPHAAEEFEYCVANLAQLVGIFRCSLQRAKSVDDILSIDSRAIPITDFRPRQLPADRSDGQGPSARSTLFRPSELGALLMKIEIPPVEVRSRHTDVDGKVTASIPREILRRVLREELGLSVSSRTVNMNCVLMKDSELPRDALFEQPRVVIPEAKAAVEHTSAVTLTNAVAKPMPSTQPTSTPEPNTDDALRKRLQRSMASGEASIVLEEVDHSVSEAEEERMAVEAVEDAVAEEILIKQAAGDDDDDDDDDKDDNVTHIDEGDANHVRSLLKHADAEEKNAREDMLSRLKREGVIDGIEESDEGTSAEAFLPYKNGTVVPITTSYITRCERLSSKFHPFAIVGNVTGEHFSLKASHFPVLRGVGEEETTIVTRVHHNDKEILAKAADQFHKAKELEAKSRKGKDDLTACLASEKPAAQAIVLDAHLRNPKKIDIYFFAGDNYDILQEVL